MNSNLKANIDDVKKTNHFEIPRHFSVDEGEPYYRIPLTAGAGAGCADVQGALRFSKTMSSCATPEQFNRSGVPRSKAAEQASPEDADPILLPGPYRTARR